MNNIMDILKAHLSDVEVPQPNHKVYKDECVYSFDTPYTDTGLYICLRTFYGLGKEHLERHHRKTGSCVYLHLKYEKIPIEQDQTDQLEEKEPTRLAIGIEGGFAANPLAKKYDTRKNYSIVVLPNLVIIPLPNDELPEKVINSVNGVINAESAKLAESEAGTWDGEIRAISRQAENLPQLNNTKKIPPSGWKCERCDLTSNLWLNLTDGAILCGRKFFDGSGGNNHALHHYNETKYPLVVKLGTITKEGKADVYSYDEAENDMVEDPFLEEHLAHFGINIFNLEKSEKSMVELELDLNKRFGEWAAIQEAGSNLTPLYGPGYTGMTNLGNSCYMNSTMQVIFTVPAFVNRYVENVNTIFDNTQANPVEDFTCQMAKLGTGLLSGKYSRPPVNEVDNSFSISPTMFRAVIGRGHPIFSTKHQQDAQEFFLHLLSLVQRNNRHQVDPTECFKFEVEERYQCHASSRVRYFYRNEYCLPLTIPMEAAVNKEEVAAYEARKAQNAANGNKTESEEVVRARIKFQSCVEAFVQSELVDQFYSSAIKGKTTASKSTRIANFPNYLVIHLKKFTVKEDWTPVKLDVSVDMPDEIDLTSLKGFGPQSDENLLPVEEDQPKPPQFNEEFSNQLMEMGFSIDACKRALHATNNDNLENATNWLMEHMDDPIINQPFTTGSASSNQAGGDFVADETALVSLMGLGFSRNHAIKALRETGNNVERAADWVFNHAEEPESEMMDTASNSAAAATAQTTPASCNVNETNFRYKLKAFISHMGTSTACGHYVCHILRDGKWVIYNDEKVALSENPPKDLGYVYLFERM